MCLWERGEPPPPPPTHISVSCSVLCITEVCISIKLRYKTQKTGLEGRAGTTFWPAAGLLCPFFTGLVIQIALFSSDVTRGTSNQSRIRSTNDVWWLGSALLSVVKCEVSANAGIENKPHRKCVSHFSFSRAVVNALQIQLSKVTAVQGKI